MFRGEETVGFPGDECLLRLPIRDHHRIEDRNHDQRGLWLNREWFVPPAYTEVGPDHHKQTCAKTRKTNGRLWGRWRRFGFVRFRGHCRHEFLRQGREVPAADISTQCCLGRFSQGEASSCLSELGFGSRRGRSDSFPYCFPAVAHFSTLLDDNLGTRRQVPDLLPQHCVTDKVPRALNNARVIHVYSPSKDQRHCPVQMRGIRHIRQTMRNSGRAILVELDPVDSMLQNGLKCRIGRNLQGEERAALVIPYQQIRGLGYAYELIAENVLPDASLVASQFTPVGLPERRLIPLHDARRWRRAAKNAPQAIGRDGASYCIRDKREHVFFWIEGTFKPRQRLFGERSHFHLPVND